MILVGIVLILLGCVFLFAGATGMPRAVLGVEREPVATVPKNMPSQGYNTVQADPENPPETSPSSEPSPSSTAEDHTTGTTTESRESVPYAARETLNEQPSSEIPVSRRASSVILGIIGVAFGVLALLDAV